MRRDLLLLPFLLLLLAVPACRCSQEKVPDALIEWSEQELQPFDELQDQRQKYLEDFRESVSHEEYLEAQWANYYYEDLGDGTQTIYDREGGLDLMWQNAGFNASGRILTHAFDPHDSRIIWAGSASGGLWKTTNAGESWRPMTDHLPAMTVSAVAIHPHDSQTLLFGTVDSFGDSDVMSADSTTGFGVFRTADGGATWQATSFFYTPEQMECNQLVWDPDSTQYVYLAASNGVWKSNDAGKRWEQVFKGNARTLVIDKQTPEILYVGLSAPAGEEDAPPGVYKSIRRGEEGSWDPLNIVLPERMQYSNRCGICMRMAISDSLSQVLFFAMQANVFNEDSVKVGNEYLLYKTTDGGETWRGVLTGAEMKKLTGKRSERMWVVAVAPEDTSVVFVGGIRLFRSREGGERGTWEEVGLLKKYDPMYVRNFPGGDRMSRAKYDSLKALPPTRSSLVRLLGSWVHVDHHDIGFDPGDPGTVYDFSDGGVYRSTDGGDTWTPRHDSLMTLQLYSLTSAPTDTHLVGAGAQDQGQLFLDPDHFTAEQERNGFPRPYWRRWVGGDGMILLFSHDKSTLYGTAQYGNHWRLKVHHDTFIPLLDRVNRTQNGIQGSRGSSKATGLVRGTSATNFWVTPKVIHPVVPQLLFTATLDSVYTTMWDGVAFAGLDREEGQPPEESEVLWKNVARIDSVSVLAIDRKNPAIVYAYSNKKSAPALWRAVGDSIWWQRWDTLWAAQWADSTLWQPLRSDSLTPSLGAALATSCRNASHASWPLSWPAPFLSDLEADPDTEGTVYATRAGYCHQVWRSTDHGETWDDITNNLGDVGGTIPVNAIAITPDSSVSRKQVYIGTDVGVYMAYVEEEASQFRWQRVHGTLPHVVVTDIHFHPVDRTIRVGTYGRGYWKAKVPR
ncbi:MAG: hypothetical protein ACE5G0_02945 [Rhodothermales bacterium]